MSTVVIKRAETDDEILSIIPLKQSDDSECIKQQVPEEVALQRVIEWREMHYDVWMAKAGLDVVGYAVGKRQDGGYRSYGIYVEPAHRNRGIGTLLKNAQIEHARKCYCEYIWSNVSENNKPSIRVQEKHGFEFERSGAGYVVTKSLKDF
ncbi:MAG: GNAT family N-acetyltransferase [Candidatus Aenigmarchaeota archaeon]|nr:GNAT family N-acetyltransferase [Candidatus Aenigmarchaeota archaeon]